MSCEMVGSSIMRRSIEPESTFMSCFERKFMPSDHCSLMSHMTPRFTPTAILALPSMPSDMRLRLPASVKMSGMEGTSICRAPMRAWFWALSAPIGSSERERSKLPHVSIRPPPIEKCLPMRNETVGWKL